MSITGGWGCNGPIPTSEKSKTLRCQAPTAGSKEKKQFCALSSSSFLVGPWSQRHSRDSIRQSMKRKLHTRREPSEHQGLLHRGRRWRGHPGRGHRAEMEGKEWGVAGQKHRKRASEKPASHTLSKAQSPSFALPFSQIEKDQEEE